MRNDNEQAVVVKKEKEDKNISAGHRSSKVVPPKQSLPRTKSSDKAKAAPENETDLAQKVSFFSRIQEIQF